MLTIPGKRKVDGQCRSVTDEEPRRSRLRARRRCRRRSSRVAVFGRVAAVRGLLVEVAGPVGAMRLGGRLEIEIAPGASVPCEVIGFSGERALAMPFGGLDGVRRGCPAYVETAPGGVQPDRGLARPRRRRAWAGRSTAGPAAAGPAAHALQGRSAAGPCPPPRRRAARSRRARDQHLPDLLPRPAHGHLRRLRRRQVGAAVDAGAQRRADVTVIGLVGERGREVQEFLAGRPRPGGPERARSSSSRPPTSRR